MSNWYLAFEVGDSDANLALRLIVVFLVVCIEEFSNATRSMQVVETNSTEGIHLLQCWGFWYNTVTLLFLAEQITVPDELVEELATLRIGYASLLRNYQEELENSPKAQEEFIKTLPGLLRRRLSSDFQSCFDTFINEEVSLFNITYLKQICNIFPEDVW